MRAASTPKRRAPGSATIRRSAAAPGRHAAAQTDAREPRGVPSPTLKRIGAAGVTTAMAVGTGTALTGASPPMALAAGEPPMRISSLTTPTAAARHRAEMDLRGEATANAATRKDSFSRDAERRAQTKERKQRARRAAARAQREAAQRAAELAAQQAAEEAARRASELPLLVPNGTHALRIVVPIVAGCVKPTPTSYLVTPVNGQLAPTDLCTLPGTGQRLRADAAAAWEALAAAFAQEFAAAPRITDSYRDLATQVDLAARKPMLAAKPGTSQHGLGIALDLASGIEHVETPEHQWMLQHAGEYGWANPVWAQPGGSKLEPWHFEFEGAVAPE